MITNPRIVSPSYSPASSTGAAPLAVGLEDEAQRPGVGQGRAKQELATGAQRRRLASGELAAADRGAEAELPPRAIARRGRRAAQLEHVGVCGDGTNGSVPYRPVRVAEEGDRRAVADGRVRVRLAVTAVDGQAHGSQAGDAEARAGLIPRDGARAPRDLGRASELHGVALWARSARRAADAHLVPAAVAEHAVEACGEVWPLRCRPADELEAEVLAADGHARRAVRKGEDWAQQRRPSRLPQPQPQEGRLDGR
eukprot:scaffold131694_cov66-Phaeocystis_antarctica.AAC.2